ncbi:serine/threonine-protein kinase ZRK1-like [Mercurialis annua]|uniref:serine/threonine-protein kinase ZRK1-like n=1 Tax=Mercurialis annua TaxID=3986 RepID=UPI00215F47DE|nr:serine/threonine-protein kinase ZRK1-like [Mercurialis annua]XP_050225715.1 serine/threonine-protein kinase ZRK1-like [Mercurialis annua]
MFSCLRISEKAKEETEMKSMKNRRMFLEKLNASCDGKFDPILTFSSKELIKATNNYDFKQMLVWDSYYQLFKGSIRNSSISVKKYGSSGVIGSMDRFLESAITDIAVGYKMKAHKNVLKLIGCCLETEFPILVYEFVGTKALSEVTLSWKCRLKVAADIADAIAYLHTALSRPVILRDMRPSAIMLGEGSEVKLMDFSLAISIPDGESHILTDICGKTGYGSPEYISSGYATEKLDVFLFGVLLVQLLAGEERPKFMIGNLGYELTDHLKQFIEKHKLIEIVDCRIVNDIEQQELVAFGEVAVSCMCNEAEDRPIMSDVAKELERIYQSIRSLK